MALQVVLEEDTQLVEDGTKGRPDVWTDPIELSRREMK